MNTSERIAWRLAGGLLLLLLGLLVSSPGRAMLADIFTGG